MNTHHLSRATRLYKQKRYRDALRLLEPEILRYQDNERYFLLLGLCCVRCHSISDALTYLKRGLRINRQDSDTLQALAICAYLQYNSADSVSYLLTVLEHDPRNKRATSLLQYIRGRAEGGRMVRISDDVPQLLPYLPTIRYLLRPILWSVMAAAAAAALVVIAISIDWRGVSLPAIGNGEQPLTERNNRQTERGGVQRRQQQPPRQPQAQSAAPAPAAAGTADAAAAPPPPTPTPAQEQQPTDGARVGIEEVIRAQRSEQYVDLQTDGLYVFNDQEIGVLLTEMESQFLAGNDNRVCVAINRLLNSNAHGRVKQRMLFLSSYLLPPDFTSSFADYSYQEVLSAPRLYNSCYVKWRGAVSNIKVQQEVSVFDFLIGYESGNVLEGVVPSISNIDYDFRLNDSYEVIAQVYSDPAQQDRVTLHITNIRPLTNEN